jgi:hypothetical protein
MAGVGARARPSGRSSDGGEGFSDCNGLSQTTATGPGELNKPFGRQNGCFDAHSCDTPHARRPNGPAGGCCTSQEAAIPCSAAAAAGHTPGWGHTRCVEPSEVDMALEAHSTTAKTLVLTRVARRTSALRHVSPINPTDPAPHGGSPHCAAGRPQERRPRTEIILPARCSRTVSQVQHRVKEKISGCGRKRRAARGGGRLSPSGTGSLAAGRGGGPRGRQRPAGGWMRTIVRRT